MKLHLLLLCFVFCFPVFGQVMDSVDLLIQNSQKTKTLKKEATSVNVTEVEYHIGGESILFTMFLEDFNPVIDTFYNELFTRSGDKLLLDTSYISRIANNIDNKGSAHLQFFYPNGELKMKASFRATKKAYPPNPDGWVRLTYPASNRVDFKSFETINSTIYSGIVEGIVEYYYPTGQVKKTEEYSANVQNGKFLSYYENGQLKSSSQYKNGHINGEKKLFYEDGSIKAIENYKVFENKKPEDILLQETLEEIRKENKEYSYRHRMMLYQQDTLSAAKEIVQLKKYRSIPFGDFFLFNKNGDIIYKKKLKRQNNSKFRNQLMIIEETESSTTKQKK